MSAVNDCFRIACRPFAPQDNLGQDPISLSNALLQFGKFSFVVRQIRGEWNLVCFSADLDAFRIIHRTNLGVIDPANLSCQSSDVNKGNVGPHGSRVWSSVSVSLLHLANPVAQRLKPNREKARERAS